MINIPIGGKRIIDEGKEYRITPSTQEPVPGVFRPIVFIVPTDTSQQFFFPLNNLPSFANRRDAEGAAAFEVENRAGYILQNFLDTPTEG